jgi:hypothetical protein
MNKIKFLFYTCLIVTMEASSQNMAPLFQPFDFTQENLFSRNIEGPSFDRYGNLYVVNFQKRWNHWTGKSRWRSQPLHHTTRRKYSQQHSV